MYIENASNTPQDSDIPSDLDNGTIITDLNHYLYNMKHKNSQHTDLETQLNIFLLQNSEENLMLLKRAGAAIDNIRYCQNKNQNDYLMFIAHQKDGVLSRKQFNKIFSSLGYSAQSSEYLDEIEVLKLLIILSNAGKSKLSQQYAMIIDPTTEGLTGNDLMAKILTWPDAQIKENFPSLDKLTPNKKTILKEVYPLMTNCLRHFQFLDGSPKLMERLSETLRQIADPQNREQAIRLFFASQFFDEMGAQEKNFSFLKDYELIRKYLMNLCSLLNDPNMVSDNYLNEKSSRFDCLQNETDIQKRDFLLRVFCTLRVTDEIKAQEIKEAFENLSWNHQTLLCEELNLRPGIGLNSFARAPDVATIGQNITNDAKDLSPEGIQRALYAMIVLARLVKKIRTEFDYIMLDSTRLCNFEELSDLAATQPEMFNKPDEFNLDLLLRTESILSPTVQPIENQMLWLWKKEKANAPVQPLSQNSAIGKLWKGPVTKNSSQADKQVAGYTFGQHS